MRRCRREERDRSKKGRADETIQCQNGAEAEALQARITVLSVKCRPELLAERIARRGRESADDILLRLKREAPIRATTARVIEIINETDPLDVIDTVIEAIRTA